MYDSIGIMGQEFRSSLASCFWLRILPDVLVKVLVGQDEGFTGTRGSAFKMAPSHGKFILAVRGLSSLPHGTLLRAAVVSSQYGI